jgi:hypothetical protein
MSSIIVLILSLGVSTCFSIIFLIPTYYSWTLNENEFWEWNLDQTIPSLQWMVAFFWEKEIWGSYMLWSTRLIIGPIGFLLSITSVIYTFYEIFNFFFYKV